MKFRSKLKLATFALGLACVSAASAADVVTDPYFRLVSELKNSADAAQAALSGCGSNKDCQLIAASKRNMINMNAALAAEARTLNPGSSIGAFNYLFGKMASRPAKIKEDLVKCGVSSKKCQIIAKSMVDQNFADELRAHRAFSAYSQGEMARLQAAVSSCATSTAQAVSTGYGMGGGISDAFNTAPTAIDTTTKTSNKVSTVGAGQ
jgi:hypothetical protein